MAGDQKGKKETAAANVMGKKEKAAANKAAARKAKRQRRLAKRKQDADAEAKRRRRGRGIDVTLSDALMAELDEGNVLNAGKEAASLDGLEDKPKAEDIVSSLLDDLIGALELEEIRLEAKPHDPKLLDIKDKVQADTALKVPRDPPSPPCVNCF